MRPVPAHSKQAGRHPPLRARRSSYALFSPSPFRIVVPSSPGDVGSGSRVILLLARLVSSSGGCSERDFGLAAWRLHEWIVFTMDRPRLSSRGVGSLSALDPWSSTFC